MGSKDNKRNWIRRLGASFLYAIRGILAGARSERNFKIHLVISIAVIFMGVFFSLSLLEWSLVIFAIGGVLAAELVNSSIERVVDLITDEYHPLAMQAKDMAAGAVLVISIASAIIGVIIFVPKIWEVFGSF